MASALPDVTEQLDDMRINEPSGGRSKTKKEIKSDKSQKPPGTIKVGLLNVRSLNKRIANRRLPEVIKELITKNNLDVFLTTETWLQPDTADAVLHEASPPNYKFFHSVRLNVNQDRKRGGGVAIQYKQELQGEIKRATTPPETFEYVAAELKHDEWKQPVLFINVYRPPGFNQFDAFLEEFKKLLDEIYVGYNSIIITGDFNIHVDVKTDRSTIEFMKLLEESGLTQHVEQPTHQSGHTLDLVITRNVEISDLTVQDDEISDHYSVYFTMKPDDQNIDE
ncbi:trichohyalin-like [Scomber scombrus]